MPGTSASGWRIPVDADPLADAALAVRNLVTDIEAGWTAWNPTFTNLAIGNGVVVARYKRVGKLYLLRWDVAGGTTTMASGAVSMSLPAAAHASGRQYLPAIGSGQLNGLLINPGASTGAWLLANGSPVTSFGNGSAFVGQGAYERA